MKYCKDCELVRNIEADAPSCAKAQVGLVTRPNIVTGRLEYEKRPGLWRATLPSQPCHKINSDRDKDCPHFEEKQ